MPETVRALDREIGKVEEVYLDHLLHLAIRYLVADTGNWIFGGQVLMFPCALIAAIVRRARTG